MYFMYNFYNSFATSDTSKSLIIILFLTLLFFCLTLIAYIIANYVLRSLGLYRLARKSGINNAWLSWIPYAHLYTLGKLSGDIKLGKYTVKNTPLWLLLTPIIGAAVTRIPHAVIIINTVITIFAPPSIHISDTAVNAYVVACGVIFFLSICAVLAYSAFLYVLYGTAYYSIYKKYKSPLYSVFYMLLTIFVPLAKGIILLKLSKHSTPFTSVAPNLSEANQYDNGFDAGM